MPFVFSPEMHDQERGLYCFRCYPAARIERWTFWIAESTLRNLASDSSEDSGSMFARFKHVVHRAALARMAAGDADVEHVLTLNDFREAAGSLDDWQPADDIHDVAPRLQVGARF